MFSPLLACSVYRGDKQRGHKTILELQFSTYTERKGGAETGANRKQETGKNEQERGGAGERTLQREAQTESGEM